MRRVICICAALIIIACGTFFFSACGTAGYEYKSGLVNITATTTMLGDLASVIGGEYVAVTTLMNAGVDPHSYQPRPSDATALTMADLAIVNGLHLEAKMVDLIEKLGEKSLVIGDCIPADRLLHDDEGAVDPHIWFDVELWKCAAEALSARLCVIDAANKEAYMNNTRDYLLKLDELDKYIHDKAGQLSEGQRILVTAHDAFGYFANAYGFKVYSIQGLSTQTEASARDIQYLADLVSRLKVRAIFVESSVPAATIMSVIKAAEAQGHKVTIGGELYSDSLGSAKDGRQSYINAVKYNVDTIVNALGGNEN